MDASETEKKRHANSKTPTAAPAAAPVTPREPASARSAQTGKHKRLGQILKGRYRIESLIASGGMSDVYKAVDRHLEEAGTRDFMVAIKILRSALTKDADALTLLAREAAKSKRLSHPNIIRVNDLDHDGDTWFMVMELLEGEPLSRVIQRAKPNGLTWNGGRAVLEKISSALAYSHRQGIVHADLKPSNIFFTRDGEVKLLDFGVAQALKPHQHVDFLSPRHDDETTVYGYTPAYASPSLIAGEDPTVGDDLYALACISYELLSSRHPFNRKKLTTEERAAFPLRRPKNMPATFWREVRSLLKDEAKGSDLRTFRTAMQPVSWQKYAYPTATAAAVAFAVFMGFLNYSQIQAVDAERVTSSSRMEMLKQVNEGSPEELLAAMDELQPLEQAGVLKSNEERLVNYYIQQMDEALQSSGRSNLPNVPAALATYNEAASYFPRDRDLLQHGERLNQRNLSLQSALSDEIMARLDQGDYTTQSSFEELGELAGDFAFLTERSLSPSDRAINNYEEKLSSALRDDDGPALARLLDVADLFFTDTEALEDTLADARNLEEAIRTLGDYHQAVANGESPAFPHRAAEDFYANRVSRWEDEIASASNSAVLDAVYNDMTQRQESMPSDFAPFARLRRILADAYMEQAETLLEANRARQAQPLLQKATTLMRSDS